MEYTAKIGKGHLDYKIEGQSLVCTPRSSPGFSYKVSLDDPDIRVSPIRRFRLPFQLGLLGVGVAVWTFGAIYLRERHLDFVELGVAAYIHFAFFFGGLILIFANFKPMSGFAVSTRGENGIRVWRDASAVAAFDSFVAALRERSQKKIAEPGAITNDNLER